MDHINDVIRGVLRQISEYCTLAQIPTFDLQGHDFVIGDSATNTILIVTRARDIMKYLARVARDIPNKGNMTRRISDARDELLAQIKTVRETIRRTVWTQIETRAVESPDDVSTLIHNFVHTQEGTLGPLYSRIARVYVPVMKESARVQMFSDIVETRASKLLRVTREPIDPLIPWYEQIYTSGNFVPLTIALSRNALFSAFDTTYNMACNIRDNFALLANHMSQTVLLVSKSPLSQLDNIIEYNNRAIYDSDFARKHGLLMDITTGLNAAVLQRYVTMRVLTPSKAQVPGYSVFVPRAQYEEASARGVIIIEALTGNMFRIVGLRADTRARPHADARVMTRAECAFLLDGQTSRAEQYNARIEDTIFAPDPDGAISDDVLAINAEYDATQLDGVDQITSAIFERIRSDLREHARARTIPIIPRVDDIDARSAFNKFIVTMAIRSSISALVDRAQGNAHSQEMARTYVRAYYSQVLRIALTIAHNLESKGSADKLVDDATVNATIIDMLNSGAFVIEKRNGSLFASEHTYSRAPMAHY